METKEVVFKLKGFVDGFGISEYRESPKYRWCNFKLKIKISVPFDMNVKNIKDFINCKMDDSIAKITNFETTGSLEWFLNAIQKFHQVDIKTIKCIQYTVGGVYDIENGHLFKILDYDEFIES